MDNRKSKTLSDLSSGSDSEDCNTNWTEKWRNFASLVPYRRSSRQKRKPSVAGPGVQQQAVILQSSVSVLAHREGINKDHLQVWKSSERRVTISKDKLTKSTTGSNSWECKILLEVFKKEKGNVTAQFYLHPNTGDQDSTAELRVHAKVSKSLFKKIKDHFKKCWIIVKSEVLDHQAGKELGFRDPCPHWIDPTKDGTVNFNHNLAPCKPLLDSSSQNVDIVIKVIFIAAGM